MMVSDGSDPMDWIGLGDVMDPSKMVDSMLEENDDNDLGGIKVWWDDESDLLS
jgi:hypothetical protein